MRARSPLPLLFGLLVAGAFATVAIDCGLQSEGDTCSPLNGNSDCESALTCISADICCPAAGSETTTACKQAQGAVPPSTDASTTETAAETSVDAGSDAGETSSETSGEVGEVGDAVTTETTAEAATDAASDVVVTTDAVVDTATSDAALDAPLDTTISD